MDYLGTCFQWFVNVPEFSVFVNNKKILSGQGNKMYEEHYPAELPYGIYSCGKVTNDFQIDEESDVYCTITHKKAISTGCIVIYKVE